MKGQRSELLEAGNADFCKFITEFLMMEQGIEQIKKKNNSGVITVFLEAFILLVSKTI